MSLSRLGDYLDQMLTAANDARRFVEGMSKKDFLADKRTQQAVVMSLVIVGEAAARMMDKYSEFVADNPDIPWRGMRGMRDRVAHGYFDVNPDVVGIPFKQRFRICYRVWSAFVGEPILMTIHDPVGRSAFSLRSPVRPNPSERRSRRWSSGRVRRFWSGPRWNAARRLETRPLPVHAARAAVTRRFRDGVRAPPFSRRRKTILTKACKECVRIADGRVNVCSTHDLRGAGRL